MRRLTLVARALCVVMPIGSIVAFGCSDRSGVGTTLPVSGRVTMDGETVVAKGAMVVFYPDAARGNDCRFEPTAVVDGDGHYTLVTKGKKGAPPGWYKVVVTAFAEPPQHPRSRERHRPVAHSLLPAKYGVVKTSDLAIEVLEDPTAGA